ncbi:hypothetical protein K438DRAFT_2018062 [Mycena galopus ATCC 62051]|nr:hypothetical protein K438DRAFT_2018062 [Mycena galopus ATCC 62051]
MPSAARKDVLNVLAIYKVPPHLSKEEFEAKLNSFLDDLVALPEVQRNVLKVEILFQNDRFDGHLQHYGYPPREPLVVAMAQVESADHAIAIMSDPEMQKIVQGAQNLLEAGACTFTVDVQQLVDRDSHVAPGDRVHLLGIYKVPAQMSREEYGQEWHKFMNKYLAIPEVANNHLKLETYFHNTALDDHLHKIGFSPAEPMLILHGELETWENVVDLFQGQKEDLRKLVQAANRDFDFSTGSCTFTGDVVIKFEKS